MNKVLPILLASTALVASPGFAKTTRHHAARAPATVTMSKDKYDAIMSRLDSVESELAAMKAQQESTAQAAQQATQSAAQANQAAAAATQTATAAQTQAEAAKTQISPLEKAVNTGWFANTKISGKAYFNVSNIHSTHTDLFGDTSDDAANGTQTELKRFYFQVDHKFDKVFSARFRTDMRYGTNGTSNDVLVYIKNAYLQATLAPEFWVKVGVADLPWVPYVEDRYGYRFVENVLIDRDKFGTSADYGVHVGGEFAHGLVDYQVSAINGAGYKTLSRHSDTIDLEGRLGVHPIKPITLAIGGYSGKLGKSNATQPSATTQRATRFNALAAYDDERVHAGVEYFHAKNWNTILTPNLDDKSDGWSAFGAFNFTPKIAVFGRYDWVKPSQDLNPDLRDNYFNVGVNYKPIKPLDLALLYKHDRVKNGFLSTSNGTIGGLDHGSYDEFGLFGQFVF